MRYLYFCFVLFLVIVPATAQDEPQVPDKEEKNGVGVMVSDFINGAFLLNYERALGKHISVGLYAGYKGKKGIIAFSGLDTDQFKTGDITYSGTKFIPEVRYYLTEKGNKMLTGFYLGSYLKFINYKSDLGGTFINGAGESFEVLSEGKIGVIAGGMMVGYKLDLGKSFSIDFLIAGPGVGNYNFKLNNVIPPPDEFYDALNEALEEYSILDFINADFEFKDNKRSSSLVRPEFRYGITLGYSF